MDHVNFGTLLKKNALLPHLIDILVAETKRWQYEYFAGFMTEQENC